MADEQNVIEREWPENYGRAWVELLEGEASSMARMCYVAMTSFGRESRAGTIAIMRRMGLGKGSRRTFKAAQAELVKLGWAVKIKEATLTTPARWRMVSPGSQGEGAHSTLGGCSQHPGEGAHSTLGRVLTAPWEGAHSTPKQEDKQEDKQERTTPSAAKAAKAAKAAPSESDSWIAEFEKRWTSKFNAPCHFKSKASSKTIQELQAKGITAAEFCARTDRYLALDDAYIRNNGYSLHGFLAWRWNQLFVEGAGAEAVDPRTIKPKLAI